jgi:hypothetical protein
MPKRRNLTRPVMRCGTGLHADQAGFQFRQEIQNSATAQLLLQNHNAIRVNAVKLKNKLCDVDPECCNLHVDGSFPLLVSNCTSMAHCDAVRVEPSTPSDECEPVSVCPEAPNFRPRRAGATRRERRRG